MLPMGSGPPASPQQLPGFGHYMMDVQGNYHFCAFDPRQPPSGFMPFPPPPPISPHASPISPHASPIVETIKSVTKGELENLLTGLEPEKRARWAAKFKRTVKFSLPGFHALLSMGDDEYADAIEGDPRALAILRAEYGNYDFKASDTAGARMLDIVIDPKREHSERFLHALDKEPEEVRDSGRAIFNLVLSVEVSDLSRGDDLLKRWKETSWLSKEKCPSTLAVEKSLDESIAAYERVPPQLREISMSEGGLHVVLKVLEELPSSVKGDSGKPLAGHYRTMMLKRASRGKGLIGAHCEWDDVDAFIKDVAIDLKAAGWVGAPAAEVHAFQRPKSDDKCIICGSTTCKGLRALKLCPAECPAGCGSRFCAGCRGEPCYVLDREERPTAANTRNARGRWLPDHGLAELQELFDKKATERAARPKTDKRVTVTEAVVTERAADWTEFL